MRNAVNLARVSEPFREPEEVPGDYKISENSRWGDAIWRITPVTAGASDVVLHWDFTIGRRLRLTDPSYEGLLDQARRVFYSIRYASQRGRNPKDTTLPSYFVAMRSLIRWMVKTGRSSFSQMTPEASARYMSDVAAQSEARGFLAAHNMWLYADTLCRIYEQSILFVNVPYAMMATHPFGGLSAHDVALQYAPRAPTGFIPPVPDALFTRSLSKALEWLGAPAVDLLALQDVHIQTRRSVKRSSGNSYSFRLNAELSRFSFDGGGTLLIPWRAPLHRTKALGELRDLFENVRDAAILVLQGFLGLRISEIAGIVAGDLPKGASWPSCVAASPSVSGLTEIFRLKGRVYKSQDAFSEVTWLLGSRPFGSDYIPPTVRALTILWKLFQPWRDLGGVEALLVSFKGRGFPWEAASIRRPLSKSLGNAQRSWVEQNIDIPREYIGWQLSSHQWRKSFANYMVRTDARLLPAIRDHFKHMSIAMTESGYLGRDPEMLGLLDDEATYAAAQFLFDAANGRPAAGKMMETIEENLSSIRDLIGVEGTEVERVIRLATLLKDDDIRLWRTDWGNCFFLPERARCYHRANGKFDLSARHPHYGQRSPGLCCGCANLLVFADNIDFWKARFESGLVVFEANKAAGEYAAAAVSEHRVRTSIAILRRLGVEVTWTPNVNGMEETDELD